MITNPEDTAPATSDDAQRCKDGVCEHGVLWSMECLSCDPSDFVAATSPSTADLINREVVAKLLCGFCERGDTVEWVEEIKCFKHKLEGEIPWIACRANEIRALPALQSTVASTSAIEAAVRAAAKEITELAPVSYLAVDITEGDIQDIAAIILKHLRPAVAKEK